MCYSELTIQPDERLGDVDSSYGDDSDSESQTTSLKSSVTNYVYENGRRYHAFRQGSYWGPNDDLACDNLDLFHHLFTLTLNGNLFLAPISHPNRVLDLGTGTGLWAIDFADMFPASSVIATDLSPVQPTLIPPNLEFQVDDFCLPWTFTKESFDFIHARSIYGCVADIPALYDQVMQHLTPGGWFEQAEISVVPHSEDGSIAGTSLEQWGPLALECGVKFGKSFSVAEDTGKLFQDAGFQNITYRTFKWPIGPWPKDKRYKEIGMYNRIGWEEGLEGWAMFLFTKFLGWSPEEVQVLLAKIRLNLRDRAIHGYQYISICYGQKPMQ
ncbi:uncharacterized protein TRUGW13939_04705 [Talaromyces rugulosus]|uniref:Methyltransferase domain-containing protein n=1 Tax=Talaromyces rugulosus TaxID=121627 RepID=A0A7H8QUE2_TALRU|nr:uncharacterized protein TRUGW13939_04705 [Talaromyces rugulosus]QKX57587.1 hypothetical protein TRUGW13939_04705 [Talaromyces rugulosus]